LRDEGQIADIGAALVESGVEPDLWPHDAEAVRPDQTYPVMLRSFQHSPFQRLAGFAGFAETGGDDDGRLDLMLAALFDDVRHRRRRRRNHRQLDGLLDLRQRGIGFDALDFLVLGIDWIQATLKTALQHVLKHDLTDRILPVAGTEHCDRFGRKQGLQVMLAHVDRPR